MFSKTFIERPRFSFVISILIVVVGIISILKLHRRKFRLMPRIPVLLRKLLQI